MADTDNTPVVQDQNTPLDLIIGDPMYWSPSKLAIYRLRWKDRYVAGTGWPSDVRLLTDEQFATFSANPPKTKVLGVDANGDPAWVDAPPLTNEQAAKLLNDRVNNALDYVAREWGYDKGIDNATTWSTSANPQFAAEGRALAQWRDAVWAWVIAQPAGTVSREGMPAQPDRPNVNGAQQ